jgi:protein SCO1/2
MASSSQKTLGYLFVLLLVAAIGIGSRVWQRDATSVTIGGSFTLVRSDTGETVTPASFRGRYMLVYFGYTYCPDVCPTSLSTIAAALDELPDSVMQKITPLFITVDPSRDTVEAIKAYVGFFHPKLIGLTGTQAQTTAAAKAYQVQYSYVKDGETITAPTAKMDYTVDHSSLVYLMAPDGSFVRYFEHGTSFQDMAKGITTAMAKAAQP